MSVNWRGIVRALFSTNSFKSGQAHSLAGSLVRVPFIFLFFLCGVSLFPFFFFFTCVLCTCPLFNLICVTCFIPSRPLFVGFHVLPSFMIPLFSFPLLLLLTHRLPTTPCPAFPRHLSPGTPPPPSPPPSASLPDPPRQATCLRGAGGSGALPNTTSCRTN